MLASLFLSEQFRFVNPGCPQLYYKMFTSDALRELRLSSDDFGIEIEISAQIARAAMMNL
jgi:hypothetical protein